MPLFRAENAHALCKEVLSSLLRDEQKLWAALQSGRGELNKVGLVEIAISEWLASQKLNDELLVLMEHRDIDFALIRRDSIGNCELNVEAVIECKFNYAKQDPDIRARIDGPNSALVQACSYAEKCQTRSAYVLYLIAAPQFTRACPAKYRDAGWQHWSRPLKKEHCLERAIQKIHDLLAAVNQRDGCQHKVVGEAQNSDTPLYCCLIACDWTSPASDQS